MADQTRPPVPTKIEFASSHEPALHYGDYTITLTQEITIPGKSPSFGATRRFSVCSPRVGLAPGDVQTVFPPDGSLGDHSNVLPHVVFGRSTLPWERTAGQPGPWIALLLFDDTERPTPSVTTLAELRTPTAAPLWPGLPPETGEDETTQVTVIDVRKALLQSLLPSTGDLSWLAHVRRGTDDAGRIVGDELAIVVGSRLGALGARSTVHLVSLERRYGAAGFDVQNARDDDLVRLVSLKSWTFVCTDEKQRFADLLLHLDVGSLALAATGNADADGYLAMGCVPLPHTLRDGSQTVSWYHGPLIPWCNTAPVTLPVRAGDALLRYGPRIGMFDVSYAAAWELGRLLTLQSKRVSTSMYLWKRSRALTAKLRDVEAELLHLFTAPLPNDGDEHGKTVAAWFTALRELRGIPFNYLVPDERLLPNPSIRFFWVDPAWIDCLLDGAFSIGRVTSADHEQDQTFTESPAQSGLPAITGFLLRSHVVEGWPGLRAEARDAANVDLPLLRLDRLSANVLIGLFEGELATVTIHQKPEGIHFGLEKADHDHPDFYKKRRDTVTFELMDTGVITSLPWRDRSRRTLDVTKLSTATASSTPAQLALQMIQSVDLVEFRRSL